MYNLAAFVTFTVLCNRQVYLVPRRFHQPIGKSHPKDTVIPCSSLPPPLATTDFLVRLYGLTRSGHCTYVVSYDGGHFVSSFCHLEGCFPGSPMLQGKYRHFISTVWITLPCTEWVTPRCVALGNSVATNIYVCLLYTSDAADDRYVV